MTSLVICLCWDACGQLRRERVLGSAVQLLAPSIGTRVRAVTRAPTSGTAQELIRASQRPRRRGVQPAQQPRTRKVRRLDQAKDSSLGPWTRLVNKAETGVLPCAPSATCAPGLRHHQALPLLLQLQFGGAIGQLQSGQQSQKLRERSRGPREKAMPAMGGGSRDCKTQELHLITLSFDHSLEN